MSATQLREAVNRLTSRAALDLNAVWRQVGDAVAAREALADVLPAIVDRYGMAAGALAAEWYDQQRAKAGVAGRFLAEPAELGSIGADELAAWGVGPLFSAEPDWSAARSLVAGGLQRRIANSSRKTVMSNSVADRQAEGWQRSTSGGCAFCQMIAGRGAVFSESSADFASHDHCQCVAVPAFVGAPRPVKPYTPSLREATDADRARVREYLRTH